MPDVASPEINHAHPRTEKEILSVLGSNLKDLGNEQGYEKVTPEEAEQINSQIDRVSEWVRTHGRHTVNVAMNAEGEDKNIQPYMDFAIHAYDEDEGMRTLRLEYIGNENVRSGYTVLAFHGKSFGLHFVRETDGKFSLSMQQNDHLDHYKNKGEVSEMNKKDFAIMNTFLAEVQTDFPSLTNFASYK